MENTPKEFKLKLFEMITESQLKSAYYFLSLTATILGYIIFLYKNINNSLNWEKYLYFIPFIALGLSFYFGFKYITERTNILRANFEMFNETSMNAIENYGKFMENKSDSIAKYAVRHIIFFSIGFFSIFILFILF